MTSVRPGDETASPLVPLPEDVVRPGAASSDPWAVQTYKVLVDGVRPGDVVRLELPEELLAEVFENRSSLRLRSGGRDVPFIRWVPTEPAIALDVADVDPVPVSGAAGQDTADIERKSRFVVELPKVRAALRRVELVSASRVTGRTTVVSLERTPRPGVEDSTADVAIGTWNCAAGRSSDLLPCSLALDFRSGDWPWERMGLLFNDANQEPLRDLRLLLWRSREALVFVRPPAGEVRLHVVSGERFPTSPPLEGIRESLLDRPSVSARLDLEAAAAAEKAAEVVRRWWLTAALALVAVVLLAVLAKAIRSGAGGGK